jgi:hypothetical protein
MKNVTIEAFNFQDLNEKAKEKVIYWLDLYPVEYEKENGSFGYSYYSELDKKDEYIIVEMCEMNNYLFNLHGEPIHHLIKG